MADYHAARRGVLPAETIITRKRLDELERVERAHDVYLRATRGMRTRQADMLGRERTEYVRGWLNALREFAEHVVQAAAREDS